MSCCRKRVSAYIDGELSKEEEIDFESHLQKCEICRNELNRERQVVCLLKASFSRSSREDFSLSLNVARTFVVRSESNVIGLKDREEFVKALTVVLFILAFFIFFGDVRFERPKFFHLLLVLVTDLFFSLSVVFQKIGFFLFSNYSSLLVVMSFVSVFIFVVGNVFSVYRRFN